MQLGYEKLLKSYNIEVTDLDEDVQIGIKQLEDLKAKILSKRRIGQDVTPESMKKIKFLDSSIIREILDYIDDNDLEEEDEEEDEEEEPISKNKFKEDEEEDKEEDEEEDEKEDEEEFQEAYNNDMSLGNTLDLEFQDLLKSGQSEFTIGYFRSNAPTVYDVIFENYDNSEENGIETSNYSLIETSLGSQNFKLTKK
jgi:hypothetical protein